MVENDALALLRVGFETAMHTKFHQMFMSSTYKSFEISSCLWFLKSFSFVVGFDPWRKMRFEEMNTAPLRHCSTVIRWSFGGQRFEKTDDSKDEKCSSSCSAFSAYKNGITFSDVTTLKRKIAFLSEEMQQNFVTSKAAHRSEIIGGPIGASSR